MQLQNSSSKPSDVLVQADLAQENSEAIAIETIQTWLVNQLAKQLSLSAPSIKVEEPLTRYGLDSIDSVTIVGDMEDWLGVDLPSTLLWDYPTIEKAATYLVQEMNIAPGAIAAEPETPVQPTKETAGKWSLWGRGK
ncbi:acyl carrier protein [Leptolyngbya sp. FACHB-541]|uniref:acyl carrier protein n=1 Tax=Leptolyngbya sp. FACHB-541 TaxID=2692810 RepID=UPI001688DD55|nr:acyl carrier protein [Leptolyngbya sp. FACHB-541]MBD1999155.1 acyl carrier protein [Leptolyngbya sp. FACHB-541]